jgi:hypothetical protein
MLWAPHDYRWHAIQNGTKHPHPTPFDRLAQPADPFDKRFASGALLAEGLWLFHL